MSECLDLPVKGVSPALWGVKVHWKWPEGSFWGNRLELQCLFADGRLDKEFIPWPYTGKLIGGLKAGERLQVRLRLVDKNGKSRDWRSSDWLDGVSSTDASDYLNRIDGFFRNASDKSDAQKSDTGWHLNKSGEAHIAGELDSLQVDAERVGQNFIDDAYIQGSTICNAKIDTAIVSGKSAGKSDDRLMKNAEDLPDSKAFTLKDNAYVFSGRAIASKICLSDDMREAVIDAVRNSEVFRSLVARLNELSAERESDAVRLQRGIDQALSDTMRNALKPGGLLYAPIKK
ncbi:hypothetical protein NGJ69_17245 [Atlantibacter hermannii]|uniref:hypothetical protein n=1 Tax=Atlantibacter hermannii TaxID=565 RepID=UPI002DB7B63A|nr:hypothetical protein [Atlantibacter hermannii]MEB7925464.1 hypothetical protein [Atlantibacter hermannii]